jgi:MFS family permease
MAKEGEFQRGWPVLSAAAVGVGLGLSPLPFYTIDVMVAPLGEEFGWSRGEIYSALAVYTLGAFFMSPVIGWMAEKFGARRVALISIVTFSLSMMALSVNTGNMTLYFVLWFLLAVGGVGTLPITFTRPVNNWFDKRRGIALGIALIATGVFGALAKSFAQHIVDTSGWRQAYQMLGLLPLIIALPIAYLSLRDINDEPARDATITKYKIPVITVSLAGTLWLIYTALQFVWPKYQELGLTLPNAMAFGFMVIILIPPIAMMALPIGTAPAVRDKTAGPVILPGMTLGETLKTWRFWLLAICFVPISYALGAIIPSLVPLLGSKGFAIGDAVQLATLTGLAVLLGRLIGGWLIDHFWAPGIAFIFLASPAVALWLLTGEVNTTTATVAILMIGFGAGVEYDFMAYLVSKYFGMKSYSAIYGALYGFFAAGAGFGPTIMNNFADSNGWDWTLTKSAILLFVFTIPLLFLGRYRYESIALDESVARAEESAETGHA